MVTGTTVEMEHYTLQHMYWLLSVYIKCQVLLSAPIYLYYRYYF